MKKGLKKETREWGKGGLIMEYTLRENAKMEEAN